LRNAEIVMDQHSAAIAKLSLISAKWLRLTMDESVIDFASGVISRHALRSLDALQLASALSMHEELQSGDTLLFIAADKRLLTAAAAEGLPIWNPETSAPPATLPPVN
jgi:predicted nucleic acid-binding protein